MECCPPAAVGRIRLASWIQILEQIGFRPGPLVGDGVSKAKEHHIGDIWAYWTR